MEIHARNVAVHGSHGPLLAPTSLRVAGGELALVRASRAEATAFGLVLAGRLVPTTGAVLLDGVADEPKLRRLVAIVDSAQVSEPEPALPLSAVLAEEIAYTGQQPHRQAVDEWLRKLGAQRYADTRFEVVPAALRTELLTELAAARPGVRALVLDRPDRHAEDDPNSWWSPALRQAKRGLAVVVLCSAAIARLMGMPSAVVGAAEQPEPLTLRPDEPADVKTTDVETTDTRTLPAFAEDSP